MKKICYPILLLSTASLVFAQAPSTPFFPDITGDQRVDVLDLWLVVPYWGSYGIADLNSDGLIERSDLTVLKRNWHQTPPTPTPAPPTPTPRPDVSSISTPIAAQGMVGPSGGMVTVPHSDGLLGGSSVIFPPETPSREQPATLTSVLMNGVDVGEGWFLGAIGVFLEDTTDSSPAQDTPWIISLRLLLERPVGDALTVKEFDTNTGAFRDAFLYAGSRTSGVAISADQGVFAVDHSGIFALFGTYDYAGDEREPALQTGGSVKRRISTMTGQYNEQEFAFPPFVGDRLLQDGRSLSMPSWQRHAWKETLKELLLNTGFAVVPRYIAIDDVFSRIASYADVMSVIQALADFDPSVHLLWDLGELPPSFTGMEITEENALSVRETLRALFAAALERRAVQERVSALQQCVQGTWLEFDQPFQQGLDDALFEVSYLWDDNWEKLYLAIEDASLSETGYNLGYKLRFPLVGKSIFTRFLGISPAVAEKHTIQFRKPYTSIHSSLGAVERAAMLSCLATLDRVAFKTLPFDRDLDQDTLQSLEGFEKSGTLLRLYAARMYYKNYALMLNNPLFSHNVLSPLFRTVLESDYEPLGDMAADLKNAATSYADKRIQEIEAGYEAASGIEGGEPYHAGGTWHLTAAETLPAGMSSTIVYDAGRERLFLFGGQFAVSPGGGYMQQWDGAEWQPVFCECPPGRWGHAVAYDSRRSKAVLFAGRALSGDVFYSDTWEWDGDNWNATGAVGPAARWGHAMAYDEARERIVLFGGQPRDFGQVFGDTWEWDGNQWIDAASTGPSPRTGAAMAYDPVRRKVILFGGGKDWDWCGDTWEWDGEQWTEIETLGPPPRGNHQMTLDTARGRVVLFGGLSSEIVDGSSVIEKRLNDTWEWDGVLWREVTLDGPNSRYRHAMAYDADRDTVVLFGGIGSQPYGDAWLYSVRE